MYLGLPLDCPSREPSLGQTHPPSNVPRVIAYEIQVHFDYVPECMAGVVIQTGKGHYLFIFTRVMYYCYYYDNYYDYYYYFHLVASHLSVAITGLLWDTRCTAKCDTMKETEDRHSFISDIYNEHN